MKLLRVVPSANAEKKYDAVFQQDTGRTKTTSFGAKGYLDHTIGATEEQLQRYRKRHRDDVSSDPTTAGNLSYYILWGDSTSFNSNLRAYKRRFNV